MPAHKTNRHVCTAHACLSLESVLFGLAVVESLEPAVSVISHSVDFFRTIICRGLFEYFAKGGRLLGLGLLMS